MCGACIVHQWETKWPTQMRYCMCFDTPYARMCVRACPLCPEIHKKWPYLMWTIHFGWLMCERWAQARKPRFDMIARISLCTRFSVHGTFGMYLIGIQCMNYGQFPIEFNSTPPFSMHLDFSIGFVSLAIFVFHYNVFVELSPTMLTMSRHYFLEVGYLLAEVYSINCLFSNRCGWPVPVSLGNYEVYFMLLRSKYKHNYHLVISFASVRIIQIAVDNQIKYIFSFLWIWLMSCNPNERNKKMITRQFQLFAIFNPTG